MQSKGLTNRHLVLRHLTSSDGGGAEPFSGGAQRRRRQATARQLARSGQASPPREAERAGRQTATVSMLPTVCRFSPVGPALVPNCGVRKNN